jgi:hypothetical protein
MSTSKAKPVRRNWLTIRDEYVCGSESLQDIASRYAIAAGTVFEHSRHGGWVALREKFQQRVSRGVVTAVVKARVRSELQIDAAAHEVSGDAFPLLATVLDKATHPETATLIGVLRGIAEAYRLQRETAGLPREKPPLPPPPKAESVVRLRLQGPDGSELILSEESSHGNSTRRPGDLSQADADPVALPPGPDGED